MHMAWNLNQLMSPYTHSQVEQPRTNGRGLSRDFPLLLNLRLILSLCMGEHGQTLLIWKCDEDSYLGSVVMLEITDVNKCARILDMECQRSRSEAGDGSMFTNALEHTNIYLCVLIVTSHIRTNINLAIIFHYYLVALLLPVKWPAVVPKWNGF